MRQRRRWPRLLPAVLAAVVALGGPGPVTPDSLATRTATAQEPDLSASLTLAADAIRRHQQPDGNWPTAVTLGPAFEASWAELNVFTPAILVDLLDPVARETGTISMLDRARGYLRGQIESTGLVRYHGDPGPVPAALRGCELPPDADDTALVWRIAPGPDPALRALARQEIERYRDGDGLYRTWLASDEEYRCFYVRYAGREWNPPDIAVEMHVHLFLAAHDPSAAAALCQALVRRADDERIWAWYSVAPLLPVLREADLAQAGCQLRVPQRFIEQAVSRQGAYLTQARLLRRLRLGEFSPSEAPSLREACLEALRLGAAGGFAGVRDTPPLLYHNDLSAAPPHFHWSADVGYALWLRLYVETARRFPGALTLPPAQG